MLRAADARPRAQINASLINDMLASSKASGVLTLPVMHKGAQARARRRAARAVLARRAGRAHACRRRRRRRRRRVRVGTL